MMCCLLGLQVRSPCCLSLTLEWVCFWPMVSQVFVGCEGGLGCPSWFVILFLCLLVLHLFWGWGGLVTGLWPLLRLLVLDSSDARLHCPDALASDCYSHLWPLDGPGTCSFLGFILGSSLSLPVLAAGLRWLRFILSCPPSVASLRWLLPWFFVGYLLACPRGAAVPLDSWVLWCS